MIQLPLTSVDLKTYRSLLINSHIMRARVSILDRNEGVLADINQSSRIFLLDGGVQVDSTADVTRQLSLTVLDPEGRILFDPSTPSSDQLFIDRFLRVNYSIWVPTLTKWIDCPVFWGPITKLEQDGQMINIEGMGKESLLLDPCLMWTSRTWKKGTKITDIIKNILNMRGENRMTIPDLNAKILKPLSITGEDQGWLIINKLAKDLDRQAYYDGSGRFQLRKRPEQSVYDFNYGVDVLTRPVMPYDFTTLRNIVQVRGPQPQDKKAARIVYTAKLPTQHSASAQALSRNGVPRPMVTIIDSDNVKKLADAKDQANNALDHASVMGGDITFDSLVIPFLEENDPVGLISPDGKSGMGMKQFTIPLLPGESMSVGYHKKINVRRVRRRRKKNR